jgi:uncharacterized SAM-binding protein YcdF (DUF218 family)
MGVPRDRIVVEPRGADLRSSAIEIRRILGTRGLGGTRVIVVTSALNSRRARLTFSDVGINVVARPTDFYTSQPNTGFNLRFTGVDAFIPSVESLNVSTRIVNEFLASIYYYLRGWLAPNPG